MSRSKNNKSLLANRKAFESSLLNVFFAGDKDCEIKCQMLLNRRVPERMRVAVLEEVPPPLIENQIPIVLEDSILVETAMGEPGSDDEHMEEETTDDLNDPDYVPAEEPDPSKALKLVAVSKLLNGMNSLSEADRQRTSNASLLRQAACLAQDLGVDIMEVPGSGLTTINSRREIHRENVVLHLAEKLQSMLQKYPDQLLMVHWDGKILPNHTGGLELHVDRLPVALSGIPFNGDIILAIEKLIEGTGLVQAQHIHKVLEKYQVANRVQLCCFDTTRSNSGRLNGAVVLLEKLLKCILLGCPCQHHVDELIIGKISFGMKMDAN